MTKRKKILICCILAALLTIVTIIPAFAVNYIPSVTPNDLGILISDYTNLPNGFYYLRIKVVNNISQDIFSLGWSYSGGSYSNTTIINYDTTNFIFTDYNERAYYLIKPLYYARESNGGWLSNYDSRYDTYYFPLCIAHRDGVTLNIVLNSTDNIQVDLYSMNINVYDYDYVYYQGYNDGFDSGFLDGQNIQEYTNLVGYVEQLIGQFTGSEVAQYITPIAIVLVVLFVYFLFIRFLLSLVKAKGIIKTCDIIMIVACIIMLVVMYAPMLDLTIKTEQINATEETTEATEQVRSSKIWIETTETGDIYHGPVGTAIVTKSETIEDIYKISEDIETEAIAYEKD